ncbi:MAG TPA: ribonuclease D [Planctomycetes bacterium]|nr:ribonuclease D [Planctomycetota bacterium]
MPPPVLVEDSAGLEPLLAKLEAADEIAIDTEADSFFHYRESVCLIQVTVDEEDWLIDPLAKLDLSPLGSILADPSKTKVLHDGEYDVLILKRDFGFTFQGIFDTRIAAAALGVEFPGLASVVEAHFGVELDKSQQRSDWSRRPLSPKQIAYARYDTRFLIPLMHLQRKELAERGRTEIHDGECRRLEALTPVQREFNPDEWVRLKGARNLDPMGRRVLRELAIWRDGEAQRRDLPPFKVLGNRQLLDLAAAMPGSPRDLEHLGSLPMKVIRRIGDALLEVTRKAREMEPIHTLPRLPAKDGSSVLDEFGHELHDRLKTWRREQASAMELDSSLVVNRRTLLSIAELRPATEADLDRVDGLIAWQKERFGSSILELVRVFEEDLAAGRIETRRRRRKR